MWLLNAVILSTAELHVILYLVKKSMGEPVAMLPHVWKIHC